MIYIRTCAYNAEKTLKRAIDSVLQQTYQDFEYHILDNGSTDRTGDIIREYAGKDKRIVPYFNKVNRAFQENPDFWNISGHIPKGDYFSCLDADDAYELTFFQEMLSFMELNHLEVAACGTVFLDAGSGRAVGNRVLEHNIVAKTPQAFGQYFPMIHWNLRQSWGKLYSSRAAAARYEIDLPDWYPKVYGGDTVNVLQSVRAVKQFGVYAKPLHYYTISNKSVSHKWIPGREETDLILHEKQVEFLQECCGTVSEQNLRFLYVVYFHAVVDTLRVLLNANITRGEKLNHLGTILSCEETRQTLSADLSFFGVKKEDQQKQVRNVLQWLTAQGKYLQKDAPVLIGIYTALNPDFERLIPEDEILWYLRRTPQTVLALAEEDYLTAAKVLAKVLAKKKCTELFPVVLAQTLASLLGNEETYIFYSKFLIQLQIQAGMYEEAETALGEWEALLPGDEDLAELREMLP